MKRTKLPTALQMWQKFQQSAIPANAPAMQHQEMKKAFYAGMASLLATLETLDDSISDEEGANILEGYKQELIKTLSSFARSDRQ